MILKSEKSRILANNFHIVPSKADKSLTRHFAERGREVDKVDAGEEIGDGYVFGHSLNVVACPTTNLDT